MVFFAYNLLLALVAVLLLPYSLLRGWKRGQPWRRLPERLGFLPGLVHQTAADSIWLHAVSMGEVLSCARLVEDLRLRFPSSPLFVSTVTATGHQIALDKLGQRVDGVFYAPLDLPFVVRRVLRRLRPQLVIVAETEIWPNLFRETKRSGAGLLLVNGRISDQSAASYWRFRFFFTQVLRYPDCILAQSAVDRERFMAAGAPPENVTVNGNLKYDFETQNADLPPDLAAFLAHVRPEPLLVAGSTREDEEKPVLEAFRLAAQSQPRALLVIAPRHPQRFDEAAEMLASSGFPHLRRSQLDGTKPANLPLPGILLLDSLGELASLYRAAQVVFVGGSLNGWGGHNVLEPALYGRPVVVGPYMQNFRDIAAALVSQRGMVQVSGPAQLGPALLGLVLNPTEASALGERGRQVAEAQRGATERAVKVCEQLFRSSAPRFTPGLWQRVLLGPLAFLWGAVARLRLTAYDRGRLARRRLSAFTICVGNLTAGGAGKTPLVAWLVEQLSRAGRSPAVLTRGYRRSSSRELIIRPGERVSPADCGDEATVLLRHFQRSGQDIAVGIGANRYEVGSRLLNTRTDQAKTTVPDVIVLDDGFQHLALERDVDLILVDVTDPFGGGRMLPLGRLREPVSSLSRAGAIILTRTEPGRPYFELEQRLRLLNPHAPIFRTWTHPLAAVEASTGNKWPLESLADKRILAFCGLGNPESFWRTLRREGLPVVERLAFRDHHRYNQKGVQRIARAVQAQRADLILTTEKDLVNLVGASDHRLTSVGELGRALPGAFESLPLCWLMIETVVEQGEELIRWIVERMTGRVPAPARESVAQSAQV